MDNSTQHQYRLLFQEKMTNLMTKRATLPQRGEKPDPHAIRDAILKTALLCNQSKGLDRRRCLVGSLNISEAYALITKGEIKPMSEQKIAETMMQPSETSNINQAMTNPLNEIETFPSSEASSEQPGIQAAEAKTSISVPTTMSIEENTKFFFSMSSVGRTL